MSLRAFHLFFIAVSVILAVFVAIWSAGMYHAVHDGSYAVAGVASLAASLGLTVYGTAFQRKTRQL